MTDIVIGICSPGTIYVETMTSLIEAMDVVKAKGLNVGLTVQVGGYVATNRNNCVETALQAGASHLMFIDTDMIFPPSGIVRLYDHDKDIVGANYNMRGNPSTGELKDCTVKMADKDGNLLQGVDLPTQLFKAHAVATGFMLIKTSVFTKMPKPWFYFVDDGNGDLHTEDVQFCLDAHRYGFDTWCSPTIQMGHIGTKVY